MSVTDITPLALSMDNVVELLGDFFGSTSNANMQEVASSLLSMPLFHLSLTEQKTQGAILLTSGISCSHNPNRSPAKTAQKLPSLSLKTRHGS